MYDLHVEFHVASQSIKRFFSSFMISVFLFRSLHLQENFDTQYFLVNLRTGSSMGMEFQQRIAFIKANCCKFGEHNISNCPSFASVSAISFSSIPECAFTLINLRFIFCIIAISWIAIIIVQLLSFLCVIIVSLLLLLIASIDAWLSVCIVRVESLGVA